MNNLFKKLFAVVLLMSLAGPAFAQNSPSNGSVTPQTPVHTSASFTANYRYEGVPTLKYDFFGKIFDANANTQVGETVSLASVGPSNQNQVRNFSMQFNYSSWGLGQNTKYRYYVGGIAQGETYEFLVNPACFVPATGVVPCNTPSNPTNPTNPSNPSNPGGIPSGPTCTGSGCGDAVEFEIMSLQAPASAIPSSNLGYAELSMQVTATANGSAVPNGQVDFYLGDTSGSTSKILTPYSGPISTGGVSFTVGRTGLQLNKQYFYKFVETSTGLSSETFRFTAGVDGDQRPTAANPTGGIAANPSDPNASFDFGGGTLGPGGASNPGEGRCGTANGTTAPTLTLLTGTLCAAGTTSGVTGENSWTWTCVGSDPTTTPANCTANKGAADGLGTNFLKNPLVEGLDTFPEIFAAIYNGLVLPISVPFIALAIMYSGFLFVVARREGNTVKLESAKRVFTWTMVGSALLLGGFVIASFMQSTLCEIIGNCPAV